MKKKLLFSLFVIISIFTITGCGNSKESINNQKGYKEGQYFINNLTFSLPKEYTPDGENRYVYRDSKNSLIVELFVDTVENDIKEYIENDKHLIYPNKDSLKEKNINGNIWLKGNTVDNNTIYYIKNENEVYLAMLSPVYSESGNFNELIKTFENSLYFKK